MSNEIKVTDAEKGMLTATRAYEIAPREISEEEKARDEEINAMRLEALKVLKEIMNDINTDTVFRVQAATLILHNC